MLLEILLLIFRGVKSLRTISSQAQPGHLTLPRFVEILPRLFALQIFIERVLFVLQTCNLYQIKVNTFVNIFNKEN